MLLVACAIFVCFALPALAFDGRPLFGSLFQAETAAIPQGRYFFVLSKNTYNGNMGGIAGANAKCLSELKNNAWKGKAGVLLNSTTVKAFICDGGCPSLQANTGYVFALAGDPSLGGASIYANGSGVGPGVVGFGTTSLAWSNVYAFGVSTNWYSGRAVGTVDLWATFATGSRCTDWTGTGSGTYGSTSATTANLWSQGLQGCGSAIRIICTVTYPGPDDTPNAFDFVDATIAQPNTLVETSQTVTGFTGTLLASVMSTASGYLEVRKNGSGAWGPSVPIQAGETLNLRMLSPAAATTRTMSITLGRALVNWAVTSADDTVTAFTIPETAGVTPSTVVETSLVPVGYNTPVTFSASGAGEVRKNGTGAWGPSVSLSPSDTLNVRITSSATVGGRVSTLVAGGGASATWYVVNARSNLFVLSASLWTGATIAGVAGANSKCLAQLTTTEFSGKGGVTLDSTTVKAFICDSTTCENPNPNETYYFARANDPSVGGASFTTNAAGMGPGNTAGWSLSAYFGSSVDYYTGRGTFDGSYWAPYPGTTAGHCSDWTSTSSSGGAGHSASTGFGRWANTNLCNGSRYLICMVTSTPVSTTTNAFSFSTTVTNPSTTVETSAVINGFTGTRTAGASDGAEVRKNGTGSWTNLIQLDPGDTLNVRFTTNANIGATHNVSVFAGTTFAVWTVQNIRENLFVITSGTVTGNMGGLAGANSTCLSDLQANNFYAKSEVTLNASTVKAFLCDSSGCQVPDPDKRYFFASSGSPTIGGAAINVGSDTLGPGDATNWISANHFGAVGTYWSGRLSTSSTLWSNNAAIENCSNWNSTAGTGRTGSPPSSDQNRWYFSTPACNTATKLICLVTSNPDPDFEPDAFSFVDVTGAGPNMLYETSAVVTGFTSSLSASGSNGAEVRKNGTGGWGSSVSISAGDTLNVRMTSSTTPGATKTTVVSVGPGRNVAWNITNGKLHLLVMTNGTSNGNLGGLAGANTFCLNDLTSNNFNGKSGVVLNANTVAAFLCDSTTCQSPRAGKDYVFALAGSGTVGGAYFTSNATGQGPNNSNSFSSSLHFGITADYWTGRSSSSSTMWGVTAGSGTCTNWSTTGTLGTRGLSSGTNSSRWTNLTTTCTGVFRLLCMVRSDTPNTFSFADLEGTTPSTVYETSTVIAGLINPGFSITSIDGAEVRKNSTGGWGTAVSVDNGDTLNVRMTSSSTVGGEVTGKVIVGSDFSASWTIRNFRENLFVLTGSTFSAPTIAAANTACLANLTANNFKGKGGLTLDSTTVKAFLCDNNGCQNAKPSSTYYSAVSGSPTLGGATFTTDAFGRGPGNTDSWVPVFTAGAYWSARAPGSTTLWSSLPSSANCGAGTTSTIGNIASPDQGRWSSGTQLCSSTWSYMCMVTSNPVNNDPTPFSFAETFAATPNTMYETSSVISGFTGSLPVEIIAGTGEVRINGSGGWSTTAVVSPGDTLNLRMTSSASVAGGISTTVQVGANNHATWSIRNAVENIFVLTNTTYSGNLGGLAGANAACLTELTNNSFYYKSEFNLSASSVKAFLCDSTSCQTTRPSKLYSYTAVGVDSPVGNFTTNTLGQGPGDLVAWSTRFGVTGNIWTGRGTGTASLYPTGPSLTCTNWSTTAGTGRHGVLTGTNGTRWTSASIACNNSYRLVCMVQSVPDAPTFIDVDGATPSTLYQTSVVIGGAGKSNNQITSSGGAEIRVNGTGGWGTIVTVNNGDTLNVRMTSSAVVGGSVTGTITVVNGEAAQWRVRNARENLFVVTSATYNGNLGGLAGANASCLTAMQGSSFQGKTGATINASTVKAFLCDDVTCQMPKPNSTYWFAAANNMSAGGASFTTGSIGQGPGDTADWDVTAYFGGAIAYWTAIAGTNTIFLPTPYPSTNCDNWTSNSGLLYGGIGSSTIVFAPSDRWITTPQACNFARPMICMITSDPTLPPDSVDPFTISNVNNVSPNAMIESSVVLSGSFSNILVDAEAGTNKLVRKNNGGAWSTSVTVNPGDTLNIRALSGSVGSVGHYIVVGNQWAAWTITVGKPHLFLLSDAAYPGNLGGLSGANAKCLSILQNGTFANKADMVLDSTTVSAFLCDSTTCQNPRPNKKYSMGRVGSTSAVPSFVTNGTAQGPLNSDNWDTNFGLDTIYWTGRSSVNATTWANSPGDGQCTNWSTSSSGLSATQGVSNSTSGTRWTASTSSQCNISRRLICMIRSNTPDSFTLASVNSASTSTVYETSAAISGLLSSGFTVTASDEIEVRKNGTGGWGSSVSVDNGDTLNIRMTSSPTPGAWKGGYIYFGADDPITWSIFNL